MQETMHKYCKLLRLSSTFADNALSMGAESNQAYLLKILKAEIEEREEKQQRGQIWVD